MKTVSVVLCTYNGAAFLRPQLDSILSQSLSPYEVIVQDDGSTDETALIIREYAAAHPCVHFFRNEAGKGINQNFFSAMQRATGDFIAVSDQDDIWEPDKLKRQMEAIGDHLLCSGRSVPFPASGYDERTPNYHLLRLLFIGSALPGHTLLFPKRLLSLVPDIQQPPTIRTYDVLLAITAAAFDSVVYVEENLVRHRMHASSATYVAPADYGKSPLNVLRVLLRDLRLAVKLRPRVKQFHRAFLSYLSRIPADTPVFADAKEMLRLFTGSTPLHFLRLQCFCVRHCDALFFVREPRNFTTRLRAALFPITCYEYYQFYLKKD